MCNNPECHCVDCTCDPCVCTEENPCGCAGTTETHHENEWKGLI